MRETDAGKILALLGAIVVAVVFAQECRVRADSQDNRPAVVLARVAVKEAGFDGYSDLPPIAAVLLRVGRGDVVRGARLHSRRVFDPGALRQRTWIAFLRGDGQEPMRWPSNVAWRNHAPRWQRLVLLARSVLADPSLLPCAPDTWGGPMDRERARRIGYVRIDCGPTRNDFYVNPPRRTRRR